MVLAGVCISAFHHNYTLALTRNTYFRWITWMCNFNANYLFVCISNTKYNGYMSVKQWIVRKTWMIDLSVNQLVWLLQTWKKFPYLLFHFDQTSHHALVIHSLTVSFGTFTHYLVNSSIWEKSYHGFKNTLCHMDLTYLFKLKFMMP